MAGKSRRAKLTLSTEERAKLEQLSRSRIVPKREAQRSEILLRYHAGEDITSISRALKMTRLSVTKWVTRALAVGPAAALKDNYHRPKEPVIGDDAKAWVVHLACSKPKDLGYAAETWSRQALASAQKTLAQSRYDYLVSLLSLKSDVGQLTAKDLDDVDRLLTGASVGATRPRPDQH